MAAARLAARVARMAGAHGCGLCHPQAALLAHRDGITRVTRRQRDAYDDSLIAEFARYFGKPAFRSAVDPADSGPIAAAEVRT